MKSIEGFRLSNEALGSIMMALQKSLLEQTDIVPILKNLNFRPSETGELYVMNPPVFKVPDDEDQELFDTGSD